MSHNSSDVHTISAPPAIGIHPPVPLEWGRNSGQILINAMNAHIYKLRDPVENKWFRATTRGRTDLYSQMEAAVGGGPAPEGPRLFHQMGRALGDFIWVSSVPTVSVRALDALASVGATGVERYPVTVIDKRGQEIEGYRGLRVTGRCSGIRLDREHSNLVYAPVGFGMMPFYKGLYVPLETWDGSDVFVDPTYPTCILVTERVRDAFLLNCITNVIVTPIEEVKTHALNEPEEPPPILQ